MNYAELMTYYRRRLESLEWHLATNGHHLDETVTAIVKQRISDCKDFLRDLNNLTI